jgi:hypothetical protein
MIKHCFKRKEETNAEIVITHYGILAHDRVVHLAQMIDTHVRTSVTLCLCSLRDFMLTNRFAYVQSTASPNCN